MSKDQSLLSHISPPRPGARLHVISSCNVTHSSRLWAESPRAPSQSAPAAVFLCLPVLDRLLGKPAKTDKRHGFFCSDPAISYHVTLGISSFDRREIPGPVI